MPRKINDKIYWSSQATRDLWPDFGEAWIFFIPKKWWLLKDWKLCFKIKRTLNWERDEIRKTTKGRRNEYWRSSNDLYNVCSM